MKIKIDLPMISAKSWQVLALRQCMLQSSLQASEHEYATQPLCNNCHVCADRQGAAGSGASPAHKGRPAGEAEPCIGFLW